MKKSSKPSSSSGVYFGVLVVLMATVIIGVVNLRGQEKKIPQDSMQASIVNPWRYPRETPPVISPPALEADVWPVLGTRGMPGDGKITKKDYELIGQFAVGTQGPSSGAIFQRADCAPKDTKGDGKITVADWVQAGRYYKGLDPWQTAGGPTASVTDTSDVLPTPIPPTPVMSPIVSSYPYIATPLPPVTPAAAPAKVVSPQETEQER